MKRFVIPLVAVLLVFVAISPAVAVPPVENSGTLDWDSWLFDCPQGFAVYDRTVGTFFEKLYYDQAGNLVKLRGHQSGTDTIHRDGDFIDAVSGNFVLNYDWNEADQLMTFRGQAFNVSVQPGQFLFKETGIAVFTVHDEQIKRAGKDVFGVDACEYFAR